MRLPGSFQRKKAEALLAKLRAHDASDEVEYAADGSRRVRLLAELDVDERRDVEGDITFAGAWVITGGAGALGRSFARHLAGKRGVKLALVGRAAPDAARRELIEELERAGAQAVYIQADVTDEGQLASALARVRETCGPLRGVIHAAGTITARPLGGKTIEEFEAVLKAKMDGAALLDELTADDPLEHFVLISSAASSSATSASATTASPTASSTPSPRSARVDAARGGGAAVPVRQLASVEHGRDALRRRARARLSGDDGAATARRGRRS